MSANKFNNVKLCHSQNRSKKVYFKLRFRSFFINFFLSIFELFVLKLWKIAQQMKPNTEALIFFCGFMLLIEWFLKKEDKKISLKNKKGFAKYKQLFAQ